MESLIGFTGLALLVLFYLRKYLLRKESPQKQALPFSGELYQVGQACIAKRSHDGATASVVVVPGFVENFLYFSEYYADPEVELILLTSADYHVPVTKPRFTQPTWATTPKARAGSIAYDAHVLNQALTHLVTTGNVRVHGHSRGGAVVLEAARQQPELFAQVKVILEAPVLPQGQPCTPMPAFARWLLPFFLPFWQQQPINDRNRKIWGPLDDARKRELIMGLPYNPKRAAIMLANLKDMADWMPNTGTDIYQYVKRGAILVPGDDRVLQSAAMLASARQAENLQIIEIEGGSHFVLADHPATIPPLRPS